MLMFGYGRFFKKERETAPALILKEILI